MKCLMVRGVLSGWSGAHNPSYTEAQIAAGTEPTTTWALTSFAGICRGYALGYGAVYMNDGTADSFLGWMNYAGNPAAKPLMQHLENMLDVASDFSRGTRFLALTDTTTDDKSPFNSDAGAQSWSQLLDYLSKSYTVNRATITGLESGELRYSGDKSYFNQFRGVILLLQGDGTGVSDVMAETIAAAFAQGVPFVVLQRDALHGAQSFDKIFASLALANADSTWAHFDATSLTYNAGTLCTEEALTQTSLSQYPMFYTGAASFKLTNENLAKTALDGYAGDWYFCSCSEEPVLDEPDDVNGVIESKTGYFGSDQLFERTFDVSATILKPEDWRSTLPEGALKFDWWGNWDEPKRSTNLVHVQSAGLMYGGGAYTHALNIRQSLITYKGQTYTGGRSYNILVIDRITGNVNDFRIFDVFDTAKTACADCAEYLNGLDADVIAFIVGWDEPSGNVVGTVMESALLRCGASRATLHKMVYRCAYILVGIPGIGAENGIERYAGEIASDPNSYVSEVFDLKLNATPALTPVMSDSSGLPHVASIKGHMDNVVFDMNCVKFLNAGVVSPIMRKYLSNVFTSIALGGKPRRVLIATDRISGTYSITDDTASGMSELIPVIKSLGFEVDVHDIRSYPRAEPSWFSDYCAITLICLDGTATTRMEPYTDAMMVAVRRGIGLLCIGDGADMSRNMKYVLRYYDLTNTTQVTYNQSAFNVAEQYAKHGSPLLAGLSGLGTAMPNDLNYGGVLTQCLGFVPVAVSTEKLEIYGYNNLKRTARIRYKKKLDRFDSLRQFKVQGFAKLTDVRFKKLDMSGSDDFWLHFGFPSVEAMDQPDITIGDATVTENDGSYIFSSRWLDKVISAKEIDPSGKTYPTNSIINTPGNTVIDSVFLKTFGISGSNHDWNKQRYSWDVTFRFYVPASGEYLYRFASDDEGTWWLDGNVIVSNYYNDQSYMQGSISISAGWHEIRMWWHQSKSGSSFRKNPEACALAIHASFAAGYAAYADVAAQVPVRLSDPIAVSRPLTVDYQTVDGTAVAGKDYVATSGTLVFEQGESLKTITVPIIGDGLPEPSTEAFTVALSNPSRGQILHQQGTVTITDNDVSDCSDSWWVYSSNDGGLTSKCPAWGPGKTIVIYILTYSKGGYGWRPIDYNRIVVDWEVSGTKHYYSDLMDGVINGITLETVGDYTIHVEVNGAGLEFYHGRQGQVEDNAGSYANYVFAYVHTYGSVPEKPKFISVGSTGQSDGVPMGGHSFMRGAYQPYYGSDGVGATESGENNFLRQPHIIEHDKLYKIVGDFYTAYVCIPALPESVDGVTLHGWGAQMPPTAASSQYVFGMRKIDNPDAWAETSPNLPVLFCLIDKFGSGSSELHTKGAVTLSRSEVGF